MPSTSPLDSLRTFLTVAVAAAMVTLAATQTEANDLLPRSGSKRRDSPVVQAVSRVRDAVVNINGQKTLAATPDSYGNLALPKQVNGMGTGVIVDQRGYIVTNHHVVDGVRRIRVTLADGDKYIARLISHDRKTDLAIIKIDADEPLPVLPLGTSSELMPGETVIAVGNAYGYEHTVTLGIISALHRTVQVTDTQEYDNLIQTDASINPGNSGGPLLNIDGEMIGLNVAVRAGAQGIGFAIPVDTVMDVTTDLLSVERLRGRWHGIVVDEAHECRGNLVVDQPEAGSPAEEVGLQPGDTIKSVAGTEVHHRLDLERALLELGDDAPVAVSVVRAGKPMNLQMRLASLPAQHPGRADRIWQELGVRLVAVAKQKLPASRERYNGGLKVVDVRAGGPADLQGIRAGDVLVGMHVWETISLDNVHYVLNREDLADVSPIKFYILRGPETLYGHLSFVNVPTTR